MNRREALRLLAVGLSSSSMALAGTPAFGAARSRKDKRPVALLLPLSGPHAALGLSMAQAASLAENDATRLLRFDTGGTAAGALKAAQAALRAKCAMVLGPLLAEEARAVAGVVNGAVPVIAFSNDASVRDARTHVFGITPGQATTAMLSYARARGVRDVLVIGDGSPWSAASVAASKPLEAELGLKLRTAEVRPDAPLPALGEAPDAIFVPGGGPAVLAAARNLRDTGVQLLVTMQALDYRPEAVEALEGAWMASPDPDQFSEFAGQYEARHGGNPGALAALAYDAATIARTMRERDRLNREGLYDDRGFSCVTGPLRFRTDGSCARQFAILAVERGEYRKVATAQGA